VDIERRTNEYKKTQSSCGFCCLVFVLAVTAPKLLVDVGRFVLEAKVEGGSGLTTVL